MPFVQYKKVKKTHGGVLLLVKLQANERNFTESKTLQWIFCKFFKLYKLVQNCAMHHVQ